MALLYVMLLLGTVAIAVLLLMAWLYSRTTIYTITNRRLVLRFGIALPVVVNLPFHKIRSPARFLHHGFQGHGPHPSPWSVSIDETLRLAIRQSEPPTGTVAGRPIVSGTISAHHRPHETPRNMP